MTLAILLWLALCVANDPFFISGVYKCVCVFEKNANARYLNIRRQTKSVILLHFILYAGWLAGTNVYLNTMNFFGDICVYVHVCGCLSYI